MASMPDFETQIQMLEFQKKKLQQLSALQKKSKQQLTLG